MRVQGGRVAGGKGRRQGQVQSRGICSLSSVRRWYGFHAFQLGHSGFFHSLEIPRNGPRGKKKATFFFSLHKESKPLMQKGGCRGSCQFRLGIELEVDPGNAFFTLTLMT